MRQVSALELVNEATTITSTAIDIQSLSKIYTGRKRPPVVSVEDLSLSIPRGQIFGLLGPNGAGKTTTIKMLCGLVTPTSGQVMLNGRDIQRNRSETMRQIGAVLEGTRNVYWRLSAWQNLMYFGRLKGCSNKDIIMRAEQLLHELDLWERRHDQVRLFSRGMQQKVAIAAVLVSDPAIVLLDEPTLGLDVQAAYTIREWVVKLSRERGKTVVITSHELDMIQEVCDRVAIMRQGKLVADRPIQELLALFSKEYYEIKLGTHLSENDQAIFDGLTISSWDGGTMLAGAVADQDRLHGILEQICRHKLPVISVNRVEPNLEEIFVSLVTEQERKPLR